MISIKYKNLRLFALVLLAIPSLIFFLSWLKLFIGIPFALLLIGALVCCARQQDDRSLNIRVSTLIAIVAVVFLWCVLSGQGGFFVQKQDHFARNVIFRDLINYNWPVRYASGNDESLVYYIGYWLLPALFGKIGIAIGGAEAGWLAGRIALLLWSTVLITVAFLLVCFYVGAARRKYVYTALIVFILFSGMDAIGSLYNIENFASHIEWWVNYFQYSSMSTQLCWVFNQAIPTWIATALMLNEKDKSCYALIGMLILSCSPLPFVGLAFFMLCLALKDFASAVKGKTLNAFFREIITFPNIAALITLIPTFGLYYMNNTASANTGSGESSFFVPFGIDTVIFYVFFVVLEFAIMLFLLKNEENKTLSVIIGISLTIIPIFIVGGASDFCMRASIPALFVLMTMLIKFFIAYDKEKELIVDKKSEGHKQLKAKFIIVLVIFLVGCITPFVEYNSSVCTYIKEGTQSASEFDIYGSLTEVEKDTKRNFVGEDSSNSLFYKTIGKS